MRCILRDKGCELLRKIRTGACGHHAGLRTLVGKAFRQGFNWPKAVADSKDIVRCCEGCQFYDRQTHLPAQALQTIPITWPFAVWHLNMVGPLRQAPGGASPTFSWRSTSSPNEMRLDPSSMSAPRRRYHSSQTSSIASAYPTRLSTRTAHSSRGRNSSTSATTTTSVWTGQLLPTRRRMNKSRGRTA
jgi:hypothetical protein